MKMRLAGESVKDKPCAGVAFNSFVPEWLQVLLLVFLLSFVIKNITTKGVRQFQHEQAAFEKQAHAQATGRLWRESALADPTRPKGITHDESFHPVSTPMQCLC